jgi:hypothetical protein
MKLNNKQGDRITPIALFSVLFPILATLWEVTAILQQMVQEFHVNGWMVHLPIIELFRLMILAAVTKTQYKWASKIARRKGWKEHNVCSAIEVILLFFVAATS